MVIADGLEAFLAILELGLPGDDRLGRGERDRQCIDDGFTAAVAEVTLHHSPELRGLPWSLRDFLSSPRPNESDEPDEPVFHSGHFDLHSYCCQSYNCHCFFSLAIYWK